MRVIFMGTPDFAVPTLDAIVEAGHEVVLVVAQPDRPAGRGRAMRAPPVAVRAKELGLPLAQPKALRSGPFPERFRSLEADIGVVIAYGRILPQDLLDSPRLGCLNVHASLLPRWRGAAPIQWAILEGDAVTGVAVQQMEQSLDTGPVYEVLETPIESTDTAGRLHDRLSTMSATALVKTLDSLPCTPTPQAEDGVTWAQKIDKSMGRVDWNEPAAALDRRIRAMSPWPGGWTPWRDANLKILEARPTDDQGRPGTIVSTRPLVIACGEGALQLERVQAPGKRPVSGVDFANGAHLQPGDDL